MTSTHGATYQPLGRHDSAHVQSSGAPGLDVVAQSRTAGTMVPEIKVDARCAERCAALATGLADCERTGGHHCNAERQRWRGFCVTNAACNPTGADPQRAEKAVQRECAVLSKRLAVCERTIDGQLAPNNTALCQEVRKKMQQLCSEDSPEAAMTGAAQAERSAAITQLYREGKHAKPAAREREAGALANAAAGPPPKPRLSPSP